jgi:hypothetical protein
VNVIVRTALARNPNTSPKILEQLATDKDTIVRRVVAQNPNTPPKSLELLATDKGPWVHGRVAYNPNTPYYIKKYFKIQRLMTIL